MSSIPTRRRLEYARGYLALGLPREALAELNVICKNDQELTDVRRVRVDLYMEAKEWNEVVATARTLCEQTPEDEGVWIAWAYALRELQSIKEAREVLLKAEPLHGRKCSVLHYNLACYASLLGEKPEARRRLSRAFKMDKEWKTTALGDTDLKDMWDEIASL